MKKTMLILIVLTMTSLCFGTTRRVPSGYSTIQAAMNVAASGDTVLVAKGTYNENVIFKANSVKLISESGPDSTEIHATGITIAVTAAGSDTTTELYGFKVTGGTGGYDGEGGGLRCWGNSLKIKNCIFTGNVGNEGGGLYLERSNSVVESCLIYGNTAEVQVNPGGTGGGIYTFSDAGAFYPIIRYNTIINNQAEGNGNFINGGGAIAIQKTAGTMIGNYIANNTSKYGNGGIAVMTMGGAYNIIISNNIIENNDTIGIEVRYTGASNVHINNNRITGHKKYGLVYTYWTTGTIDATNNWWGSASGPYHTTLNPSGTGDAVRDTVKSSVHSVNFNPWLTDTNIAIEIVKPIEPYKLSTCWPNPFVHQTSVKLDTRYWVLVSAIVFDITGREVRCIMNNSAKSAGSYNITWDGKDKYGKQVPPGMYFYRVKVNNTCKTMKVIMIR